MYRRIVYEKIGDYNPDARLAEDYEYWLRVRSKFRMKKISKCLYYYRVHSDQLATQHSSEIEAIANQIRDKYISVFEKNYAYARSGFLKRDYKEAKELLWQCLPGNILNLDVWRMLAILYLDPVIVKMIRRLKLFLRREFNA